MWDLQAVEGKIFQIWPPVLSDKQQTYGLSFIIYMYKTSLLHWMIWRRNLRKNLGLVWQFLFWPWNEKLMVSDEPSWSPERPQNVFPFSRCAFLHVTKNGTRLGLEGEKNERMPTIVHVHTVFKWENTVNRLFLSKSSWWNQKTSFALRNL